MLQPLLTNSAAELKESEGLAGLTSVLDQQQQPFLDTSVSAVRNMRPDV